MEHESNGDTNYNWCTWNGPQRLSKGIERDGNLRMCQDNPNYSITKIMQNIEKSPGDLRRLAVDLTPVRDHHLMLV